MNVSAIIVAAGKGERMGKKKQFLSLAGRPMLYWTLEKFQKIKPIKEIVLVLPKEDILRKSKLIKTKFTKVKKIIPGGKIRQESVFNGLTETNPNILLVAIQDGVRPLVSEKLIKNTIKVAERYGSAVPALPVRETVKTVSSNKFVETTLPRKKIWATQTPQIFRREIILKAHRKAKEDRFIGTDDAQLVERIGCPVKLIPGEYTNIKITLPEDLLFAQALISADFLKHR